MARVAVVDAAEGTRVPFLRGILTRSLSDAGLSFEQAYELASKVRDDIAGETELSTGALKKRVAKMLREMKLSEVLDNYENGSHRRITTLVIDTNGQVNPFSTSDHQRCLQSIGLSLDKSATITRAIWNHLLEKGIKEIHSNELGKMTYAELKKTFGAKTARNYLVWISYTRSGRPLILLLGGTTGCGKSTIATEVAHRLGIIRTQSTDMLREVMRMMTPKRLLPSLHTSSFNAWRLLPGQSDKESVDEKLMIAGYTSQVELLSLPCEAVVQRALRERVSLILEGVHVHPSLAGKIDNDGGGAAIVSVMLAVVKQERLKRHLSGRGESAPGRGSQKYLSDFDSIWALQSALLYEADVLGVPIVNNDNKDEATDQIMRIVIAALAEDCDVSAKSVFG